MQGWIKLHRKLIEWEWFHQPEMLLVFIYLLLKANHQDGNWQGMPVKRGQLITGRKRLGEETGLSEQKIRGCLKRLKSTNDITIKPTNRFSLITICNYCTYQPDVITVNQPINQLPNQQITNKQPTDNQQITTNKNDETDENKKNDKKNDTSGSSFSQSPGSSVVSDEQKFALRTVDLFGCAKNGDKTTLKRIAEHLSKSLDEEVFDKAWRVAQECVKTGDKPIALFISRIKEEFNYRKALK